MTHRVRMGAVTNDLGPSAAPRSVSQPLSQPVSQPVSQALSGPRFKTRSPSESSAESPSESPSGPAFEARPPSQGEPRAAPASLPHAGAPRTVALTAPPAAALPVPAFTVGFDLDMTLIDSRPGIKAVYDRLAAETGVFIDSALAVTRLGPPLDEELANWFPAERVAEMSDRYRALYPDHAIVPTPAMPGAADAIEAVRAAGGRPLVVTAKYAANARLHLDHLGIDAELRGWLWAEAKAEALIEYGAAVYVGDHTGDVRGARKAGALSVAVATGPCTAAELRAAGADVVLDDLTEFPGWLADYTSAAA